jgi:hypothetical protein
MWIEKEFNGGLGGEEMESIFSQSPSIIKIGGVNHFNGFFDNTYIVARTLKKPSTLYFEYSRKPKSDIEKIRRRSLVRFRISLSVEL